MRKFLKGDGGRRIRKIEGMSMIKYIICIMEKSQ
jgi:hypothetical protein